MPNQTSGETWQQILELPPKSVWARLPFALRMTIGTGTALLVSGAATAGVAALLRDTPQVVQATGGDRAVPPPVDVTPSGVVPVRPGSSAGLDDGYGRRTPKAVPPADPPRAIVREPFAGPEPTAAPAQPTSQPAPTRKPAPRGEPAPTRKPVPPDEPAPTRKPVPRGEPAPTREPVPAREPVPTGEPVQTREPGKIGTPVPPPVTTRTVSEILPVPFPTRMIRDWSLPRGAEEVEEPGVRGEQTVRYQVTYTAGEEIGRELLDATITREPQARVVAYGGRQPFDDAGAWADGWDDDAPLDCDWEVDDCLPSGRGAECPAGTEPAHRALRGRLTILPGTLCD